MGFDKRDCVEFFGNIICTTIALVIYLCVLVLVVSIFLHAIGIM